MIVVGLTGNFGTGKTTVCEIMAELGATTIDADKLGHELLKSHSQTYDELINAFGTGILSDGGEIDRQKLGKIAFNNSTAQKRLNQIMHPKIYGMVQEKIERYRKRGDKVVVLEAALLIEAGWTMLVDQVWVTVAPKAAIISRLKNQRGLDDGQIVARLDKQMPSEEKIKRADVVIDTDCSLEELNAKVTELWRQLQSGTIKSSK